MKSPLTSTSTAVTLLLKSIRLLSVVDGISDIKIQLERIFNVLFQHFVTFWILCVCVCDNVEFFTLSKREILRLVVSFTLRLAFTLYLYKQFKMCVNILFLHKYSKTTFYEIKVNKCSSYIYLIFVCVIPSLSPSLPPSPGSLKISFNFSKSINTIQQKEMYQHWTQKGGAPGRVLRVSCLSKSLIK